VLNDTNSDISLNYLLLFWNEFKFRFMD